MEEHCRQEQQLEQRDQDRDVPPYIPGISRRPVWHSSVIERENNVRSENQGVGSQIGNLWRVLNREVTGSNLHFLKDHCGCWVESRLQAIKVI